jgi:hypothetical protein
MAMTERIVTINDSVHDKVQELLPWFVVDTLTGKELELVNQHLNICAECQADFAWQCKLQATAPVSDTQPDVDRAFSKLRARLDANPRQADDASSPQLTGEFRHAGGQWMRWAMAAQFLAIVCLAVLLATPYGNVAVYRTLGASQNVSGNMVVVFRPETSERELRRILHAAGARIVDGPTITDAYLLNIPEDKLAGALHDLRSNNAVTLAESLRAASLP